MGKRKLRPDEVNSATKVSESTKKTKADPVTNKQSITIQIVAGSYDRILHGITAVISDNKVLFADTFLFNAHTSAIRCLALSPPSAPVPKQSQKIILATGSTDERINLYHLSAHAPSHITVPALDALKTKAVVENPGNRELGSLIQHSSSITALCFPTRSKLLSAAEDNTIAVTRTRDWSLLSTIKAPIPKPVGRPSGDTAATGTTPSGINDLAVHPSMKLMISVGKGERCMRLWNLVTGKKAGVLNFDREWLEQVGEGRHSSGEGRKVAWGSTDNGEEFCVVFDRGILVFGMDSKPKCRVMTEPSSKIHQARYVQVSDDEENQVLAVSTEDGRIVFFSTRASNLMPGQVAEGKISRLPSSRPMAYLGGSGVGLSGRIKDFTFLKSQNGDLNYFVVTGSSDGAIRIWRLAMTELSLHDGEAKQVGSLVGTYESGNRITCIDGFVMLPQLEGAEDNGVQNLDTREDLGESSSSSSDSE